MEVTEMKTYFYIEPQKKETKQEMALRWLKEVSEHVKNTGKTDMPKIIIRNLLN